MVCAHEAQHTERQLTAEDWRGEHVARINKRDVDPRVYIDIEIDVDRWIEPSDRNFARSRNGTAGADRVVVVHDRELPTGLLRHRREAAKQAGEPEADAVFIGKRKRRQDSATPSASKRLATNRPRSGEL